MLALIKYLDYYFFCSKFSHFLLPLIVWGFTEQHPIVDLSVFKDRNFAFGMLITCAIYLAFSSEPKLRITIVKILSIR